MAGINRIRVPHPGLYLGNGKLTRARADRRFWRGRFAGLNFFRYIESRLPSQPTSVFSCSVPRRLSLIATTFENIIKPQQPACRYGRCPLYPFRPCDHDLLSTKGLHKIMRAQSNATLGRRQPERFAHQSAHPGVRAWFAGPNCLVQPAKTDKVGTLHPGFKETPYVEAWMGTKSRSDNPARHQNVE